MKGENYITHSYAVEAIMKGLAKRLAPKDVEYWGIVGLLFPKNGAIVYLIHFLHCNSYLV